jgi:membrane-associated phospholipid phosphatase
MGLPTSGTKPDLRRLRPAIPILGLLLILGIGFTQAALAADPGPAGNIPDVRLNKAYFKGYLRDAGSVATAPLSWDASDWLEFSLIAGATVAVAHEEDHIQRWVLARRNDDTHFAADLAEPLGNGRYVMPALGVLYLYGRVSGRDRARSTALLSFESVIISGAFTGAIKYLSHKHRPTETHTEDTPWEGPSISRAYVSFPSGHAACTFAIGTVVASEYGDHRLVPPLAYAASALCALSRVHDNEHWVSDVIVGSAIGHFTARTIVGRHNGIGGSGFSLVPAVSEEGLILSLAYRF